MLFWVEISPKLEDEDLSEKFSAENMSFVKSIPAKAS
jgi:hypothetical protein